MWSGLLIVMTFFGTFSSVNSISFHNSMTPITPKSGLTASLYLRKCLLFPPHIPPLIFILVLSFHLLERSQFSQSHLLHQTDGGLRIIQSTHVPARVRTRYRLAKPCRYYFSIHYIYLIWPRFHINMLSHVFCRIWKGLYQLSMVTLKKTQTGKQKSF